MPVERPNTPLPPPLPVSHVAERSKRKRTLDVENPSPLGITDLLDGAPAAKKLRTSAATGPMPQAPQGLPPYEVLKHLTQAISEQTLKHDQLNFTFLVPLSLRLKSFARLGVQPASAQNYQASLIMLLEAGGRTDALNMTDALYEHLKYAPPQTLREFLVTATRWLPSANPWLTSQLAAAVRVIAFYPDEALSKEAKMLHTEFTKHREVKDQANRESLDFRDLEHSISGNYKLRIEELAGEYQDEARYNIAQASRVVRHSRAVDPGTRDQIAGLQNKIEENQDIESHVYSENWKVTPAQVKSLMDRAKHSTQTLQLSVGTDETHAIGVTLRIHADRASIGILNTGAGAGSHHQWAETTKEKIRALEAGLWVKPQDGEGNCVVRTNRLAERVHAGRQFVRELHILRRGVFVYVHDRSTADKTLSRAAGLKESERLFGGAGGKRSYINGEMRVDNVPLSNLNARLVAFLNAGLSPHVNQYEAMDTMYRTFGAIVDHTDAKRYLPGKQGALALETMRDMGLFISGGADIHYFRPTNELLASNFMSQEVSGEVLDKLRDSGVKRPISGKKIRTFLDAMRARAGAEGAFHYTRIPPN